MMEPQRHQWIIALVCALAAHLAVAKLLEPPTPIALDDPGIRIALGGTGPAGGDTAGGVESVEADTLPTETLETTITPAVIAPVLATVTETIRAAELAPSAPITAAEPATPQPKAEALRSRETPPPRTARTPKPQQTPETDPHTKKPRPTAAKQASADAGAGAAGKATDELSASGAGALSAAGAGNGVGGTARKSDGGRSKDRYYAELAAWLERHKRYPPQARKMHQEGIVRVRFVIDRNGKVVSHRIETSSGHTLLDQAASELLRRASPMPAIPASMGQSQLEILVPIAYRLR